MVIQFKNNFKEEYKGKLKELTDEILNEEVDVDVQEIVLDESTFSYNEFDNEHIAKREVWIYSCTITTRYNFYIELDAKSKKEKRYYHKNEFSNQTLEQYIKRVENLKEKY